MKVGLEPKVNSIKIKKICRRYEINFNDYEIWLYLSRENLTKLRDKINKFLKDEDKNFDILREKQDYIDEVKRAGGKAE